MVSSPSPASLPSAKYGKKSQSCNFSFMGYFLLVVMAVYHFELKHGLRLAQFDIDKDAYSTTSQKTKFVVRINPEKLTGGLLTAADTAGNEPGPWEDDDAVETEDNSISYGRESPGRYAMTDGSATQSEYEEDDDNQGDEGYEENEERPAEQTDTDVEAETHEEDPFFTYRSDEERDGRSYRFPSVDQRVRRYMSSWYLPPCLNNKESQIIMEYHKAPYRGGEKTMLFLTEVAVKDSPARNVFRLDSEPHENQVFYFDPKASSSSSFNTTNSTDSTDSPSIDCGPAFQCEDTILPVLSSLAAKLEDTSSPIIMQYGDFPMTRAFNQQTKQPGLYPGLPVFVQFRETYAEQGEVNRDLHKLFNITETTETACSPAPQQLFKTMNAKMQLPPIVWKRNPDHEIRVLERVRESDTPWSKKENVALFRGTVSGIRNGGLTLSMEKVMRSQAACLHIPRCFLTLHFADSPMVDAKLVGLPDAGGINIPRNIEGVEMFTEKKITYYEALKYKAQIVLEGDDVATNLKWALYSQSVVLAPPFTRTAWFLEEMLEPWVHYVPLSSSLSDVERKMQWIIDNDEEAQAIARRGFLWVQDLLFHPDAEKDDRSVSEEMIRRYQKHFILRGTNSMIASTITKSGATVKTNTTSLSHEPPTPTAKEPASEQVLSTSNANAPKKPVQGGIRGIQTQK